MNVTPRKAATSNGVYYVACVFAVMALAVASFTVSFDENAPAYSGALGGIQLLRPTDISVEREVLTISEAKVTAKYEFFNETDHAITAEVVFRVPEYEYEELDPAGLRSVDDFRLWVEGKETKYETDVRAKQQDRDYTDLLTKYGLDVASFAHYDTEFVDGKQVVKGDIARLSPERLQDLESRSLLYGYDSYYANEPLWSVAKTYHWAQTFPAHKIVHVRHEYAPVLGFRGGNYLDPDLPRSHEVEGIADPNSVQKSCVDTVVWKQITGKTAHQGFAAKRAATAASLEMRWVDYALMTSNNWKGPINDFSLIVERSAPGSSNPGSTEYVSSCWPGPVKPIDANHLAVHETNFVPRRDLHIVFFSVSE